MKRKAGLVGAVLLYLLWNWLPLLLFLSVLLFLYYTRNNGYWRERGVPYVEPAPVLGNLNPLLHVRVSPGQFLADIYNQAPGERVVGFFIFDRPSLVVRDPELIRSILVKDFEHFPTRHTRSHSSVDPVGAKNMFAVKGQRWKLAREQLTACFTAARLRGYLPPMAQCGAQLADYLQELSADTGSTITIRDLMARSATDVISACMFGISSNALRNKEADFRRFGKKVFGFTKYRAIELLGLFFAPGLAKIGKFQFFQQETTAFFRKVFGEAMEYRMTHNVDRNDLMGALIKLKNNGSGLKEASASPELVINDEDVVGQSAIFFAAGFETTSITLSFSLYELAVNTAIQGRLRQEILSVMEEHGGRVTYEGINQMKYLDMVVSETLRKYPPLPYLDRECLKDYRLPGTDVTVEKGTPVFIPAFGIHRDPQYYPEPERFDPERFTEESRRGRPQYAYMPFGQGPHNCIGMRFGLLSAKVLLVHVLSRLEVAPSEDTPRPVRLSPFALFLSSVGGIPLAFRRLTRHT